MVETLDVSTAEISTEDTPQVSATAVTLTVDGRRAELYEELHNRPSPLVDTPCVVSHMAIRLSEQERLLEHAHLEALCHRFSINPPAADSSCYYQNFGGFELRWEKHLEFSTYTFIAPQPAPGLFNDSALRFIPRDWLTAMPGQLIVAVHLAVIKDDQPVGEDALAEAFEGMRLSGSVVAKGKAEIQTSFRIHSDGFSRFVIRDRALNAYQAGRLIQRVLEIETYRLMALLGLPIARELAPKVTEMEETLARINQRIATQGDFSDDQEMLESLTKVAAQVEKYRSDTNYRFGATNAYFDLVSSRLQQLREEQVAGRQTLQEFLDRRLGPGISTCNAIRQRMEDLSRRVAQTSSLLRTRVELNIATQNQRLLESLDHRSGLQLRLQQAVEGFSVAAITYYLVGLLSYVYSALIEQGVKLDKTLTVGISVPIVLVMVWLGTRGLMHAMLPKKEQQSEKDSSAK
jgi:uncharacterized membrane-anchored protein